MSATQEELGEARCNLLDTETDTDIDTGEMFFPPGTARKRDAWS
jgi:hypothetical protein